MRITALRAIVGPIKSDIINADIDFLAMTACVVAVETDAVIDGRPFVSFGFEAKSALWRDVTRALRDGSAQPPFA